MSLRGGRLVLLAGLAVLAAAGQADAQQPRPPLATLMGRVTAEGGAVEGAVVVLDSLRQTQTDPTGLFRFDSLTPGSHRLEVRAIGFHPVTTAVRLFGGRADAIIRLSPLAQPLPEIVVTGRRRHLADVGFYRRRDNERARFLERDTLLRLYSLSLLRGLSRLPGFRYKNPGSLDPDLASTGCRGGFDLWVDGWYVADSDKAFFLRTTRPREVDGVEIYEDGRALWNSRTGAGSATGSAWWRSGTSSSFLLDNDRAFSHQCGLASADSLCEPGPTNAGGIYGQDGGMCQGRSIRRMQLRNPRRDG
jgi:hypothetical protein